MKNRDKIIGSIAIFLIFTVFLVYGYLNKRTSEYTEEDIFVQTEKDIEVENSTAAVKTQDISESKTIKVQIKGEVKNPGVYTLDAGARVEDLIKMSGGFTEMADVDKLISQAKKLKDEECINVLNKNNSSELQAVSGQISAESSENQKVNLNTATKEQLMTVPGIGETIAASIIEYRETKGGFKSIEELKNVNRVGEKTFEKMKDKIDVE